MNDLVEKLKNLKNATAEQYSEAIHSYSQKEVLKELKDAGITIDDISHEEYEELLNDKIKESRAFSKGAMVAGGTLLFLEFLG